MGNTCCKSNQLTQTTFNDEKVEIAQRPKKKEDHVLFQGIKEEILSEQDLALKKKQDSNYLAKVQIKDILRNQDLSHKIVYRTGVTRTYSFFNNSNAEYNEQKSIALLGTNKVEEDPNVVQLQQILHKSQNEVVRSVEVSLSFLFSKLSTDDIFLPLPNYQNLVTLESIKINPEPEQILILVCWTVLNDDNDAGVSQLISLYDKNKIEWNGKVRMVAVNLFGQNHDVQEQIQSQNWYSVQHIGLENSYDDAFYDRYINSDLEAPYIYIIGGDGRIAYVDSFSQTDLVTEVSKVLDARYIQNREQSHKKAKREFKQLLHKFQDKNLVLANGKFEKIPCQQIQLKLVKGTEVREEVLKQNFSKVEIYMKYQRKTQQTQNQEFLEHLKNFFGENNLKINEFALDKQKELNDHVQSILQIAKQHGLNSLVLDKGKIINIKYFKQSAENAVSLNFEKEFFLQQMQIGILPFSQTEIGNKFQNDYYTFYDDYKQNERNYNNSLNEIKTNGLLFEYEIHNVSDQDDQKFQNMQSYCKNYEKPIKEIKTFLKQVRKEPNPDFILMDKSLKSLPYQPTININLRISELLGVDQNEVLESIQNHIKPIVTMVMRKIDFQIVKPLIEKLESFGQENIQWNITLSQTVDLEYGQTCKICSQKLSQDEPQYYCFFTKEYLCVHCGDQTDHEQIGIEKYIYPHNLIYINTQGDDTLLKNIDLKQIGNDNQPQVGEQASQNHNCSCIINLCNSQFHSLRWVCLNCRSGPGNQTNNICDYCFKALQDPKNPNYKEAIDSLNQPNQIHKQNHIFNRILFDTENEI